ncbi:MAG TPA: hypothetical protein VMM13_19175 [Euzebya sp.]|nr:hypothetical protein [Euzebya sp.]
MRTGRREVRGWLVLGAILVLPALGLGRSEAVDAPERVHLYVAVPADQTINYAIADAALHEAELAMAWLEEEAGQSLRRRPADFAEILTMPMPRDAFVGDVRAAFAAIHAEVTRHVDDPRVFPLILADVRTETGTTGWLTCGLGGTDGVVMFLGNCPDDDLSTRSTWGSEASFTIAHELVHGLGAVQPCAPHESGDGHVTDDPRDVLYAGRSPRTAGQPVVLDAGNDDYMGHQIPGCPDIRDSPLWSR